MLGKKWAKSLCDRVAGQPDENAGKVGWATCERNVLPSSGPEPQRYTKVTADPRLMAYDDKRYRLDAARKEMRK